MHSYLFASPIQDDKTILDLIIKYIPVLDLDIKDISQHPDILIINNDINKSIKLTEINEIKTKLFNRPVKLNYQLLIIQNAHNLTIASQNALLKLLEEPGLYTKIILITDQINKLLPTIHSRCQIFYPKNKKSSLIITQEARDINTNLDANNIGQRLKAVELLHKDKNKTLEILQQLIELNKIQLINQTNLEINHKKIRILMKAITDIQTNINLKLAVDQIAIELDFTN